MSETENHLGRFFQRIRELEGATNEPTNYGAAAVLQAPIDPFTELPSRKSIIRLAELELKHRQTSLTPLTLMRLDVDNFTAINQRHGLHGGDAVLRELVSLLVNAMRPGDYVGRYGGDLFLVVASETGAQQAEVLGERIRLAVEEASFSGVGETIKITAIRDPPCQHLAKACRKEHGRSHAYRAQ